MKKRLHAKKTAQDIKKRIARIALVLAGTTVIGAAAGCGQNNGTLSEGPDTASGGQKPRISLDVWVFFDENTPGTYYVDLWKELAEEKGYEINLKTYSTEQIKDKLRISLTCRELPDIFAVWGGTYPDFLFDARACLPVQDYIKDSDLHFKDSYTVPYEDGNNYIIPCLVEAYGVTYCNQDLMEQMGLEMPENWEELLAFVEAVNTYNKENGTDYSAIELGDKDNWLGELLYTTMVNTIDPYAQDKLASGELSFDDSVFLEAAEKLCTLRDMGAFPDDFLETGEVEAIENFIDDEAVLFPHQSTIVYYLMEEMGEDAFSMEQFPCCGEDCKKDHDRYLMDINHTMTPGLCVSSHTEYPDEAAQLCLEFAKEVNQKNVTEYGYLDLMEGDGLEYPDDLPAPVEQLHTMVENADKFTPLWYAVLEREDGDNWRNLTKKLLGSAVSPEDFTKEGEKYLNF